MKINSSFGFRPLEFQPTKAPSTQGNGLSDDNIPSDDEYVYENSEDTVT